MKRKFIIGDEWIYFKIYTGIKTADKILIETIDPLSHLLFNKKIIDKFFFIRYYDPEFHLRIRFKILDNKIGDLITIFNNSVKNLFDEGLIWKIQIDTYNRELERYGSHLIENAESIFTIDSISTIKALNFIKEDDNLRWLWGLASLDSYLNLFEYTLEDKILFIKLMKDFFSKEININHNLNRQLSLKYRNHKKEIENILDSNKLPNELKRILDLRTKKIISDVAIIKSNLSKIDYDNVVGSYLHMTINRLFRSKNRENEFAIYCMLSYYLESIKARLKYTTSSYI